MSTAWYMVDDEDNIAILDMNENGPIPWGTPEECIGSLTLGYVQSYRQFATNLTVDFC